MFPWSVMVLIDQTYPLTPLQNWSRVDFLFHRPILPYLNLIYKFLNHIFVLWFHRRLDKFFINENKR